MNADVSVLWMAFRVSIKSKTIIHWVHLLRSWTEHSPVCLSFSLRSFSYKRSVSLTVDWSAKEHFRCVTSGNLNLIWKKPPHRRTVKWLNLKVRFKLPSKRKVGKSDLSWNLDLRRDSNWNNGVWKMVLNGQFLM